jgi:hypothetical protein
MSPPTNETRPGRGSGSQQNIDAGHTIPEQVRNRREARTACHCPRDEQIYLAGGWMHLDTRDRRCHPDQLSDWALEGIRRHDGRRKRARAWMADPANAEAVAIIKEMLGGGQR